MKGRECCAVFLESKGFIIIRDCVKVRQLILINLANTKQRGVKKQSKHANKPLIKYSICPKMYALISFFDVPN